VTKGNVAFQPERPFGSAFSFSADDDVLMIGHMRFVKPGDGADEDSIAKHLVPLDDDTAPLYFRESADVRDFIHARTGANVRLIADESLVNRPFF
jgi:hypothetical protein